MDAAQATARICLIARGRARSEGVLATSDPSQLQPQLFYIFFSRSLWSGGLSVNKCCLISVRCFDLSPEVRHRLREVDEISERLGSLAVQAGTGRCYSLVDQEML